jgi:hypothetical protein
MYGRMYVVPISSVASPATAAFDAFELKATASKGFRLHELVIAQDTDTDSEMVNVTIKRAAGSYTSGSGGSAPTAVALNSGDSAAAVTAETMNTTQALVGTGTLVTMFEDAFNVLSGWHFLPTPETRPEFVVSESCVVSIGAHADAFDVCGYAVFEEMP